MVGTTARRRPSCSSGDCGGGGDHIYSAVSEISLMKLFEGIILTNE